MLWHSMISSETFCDCIRMNRIGGRSSNWNGSLLASSCTFIYRSSLCLSIISTGISFTFSVVNQRSWSISFMRTLRFVCLCYTLLTAFLSISAVIFPFIRATMTIIEYGEYEKRRSRDVIFLMYRFSGITITVFLLWLQARCSMECLLVGSIC